VSETMSALSGDAATGHNELARWVVRRGVAACLWRQTWSVRRPHSSALRHEYSQRRRRRLV